jgi:hypothetical protein
MAPLSTDTDASALQLHLSLFAALIYFLRFLRFLRNERSVKVSDGISWLDQAKEAPARSKSSSKLLSLCSTQRHNNRAFRQTPPYYGERNPCVAGNPVSHH